MSSWYRAASRTEKHSFWACYGGWGIDSFDVNIFALVVPTLLGLWGISRADAGAITSVTLFSTAIGGWLGGALSDRMGRVRCLKFMIAWFAIGTFISAFAQNFEQMLVLKALQGFGFGGEWAVGVALLSEAMHPERRGRALGTVQSAWAVGWGAAVLAFGAVYSLLPEDIAWRVLFAGALLPALLVLWSWRGVPEPAGSPSTIKAPRSGPPPVLAIFAPSALRTTLVGLLFGAGAHGGYYAVTSWLPTYLKTERHLSILGTGGYLAVIVIAFFCGCIAAAQLLDRLGRRMTVGLFAVCCIAVVLLYTLVPISNGWMLVLGFPLGFFAAGIPASMGALFSELYPGGMRGTGVGFCYNAGRILSAIFPTIVGVMSDRISLGAAIGVDAAIAYGLVVVALLMLPETRAVNSATELATAPHKA